MRPQVRIIEPQSEEIKPSEISQSESEYLLSKYGYGQSNVNSQPIGPQNTDTFEEMIRKEEMKNRSNQSIPKRSDGYNSETKWGSDIESGLSFKIEIVTDMKIPK
jgi:hypothetical protein